MRDHVALIVDASRPSLHDRHLSTRAFGTTLAAFAARAVLTTLAAICNVFDFQRHMISQPTLRFFRAWANCVWNLAAA
jgi:hypothetical protein